MAKTDLIVLTCNNPECNKAFRVKCPGKNGTFKVCCPSCKQVKYIRLGDPVPAEESNHTSTVVPKMEDKRSTATTQLVYNTDSLLLEIGKIVRIKRFWKNVVFPLSEGINLIGREDNKLPSHISISDDPTISRQSVEIMVTRAKTGGYSITLSVLNAVNPIIYSIYNSSTKQYSERLLKKGDTLSMHYGDKLKLGNSLFEYQK